MMSATYSYIFLLLFSRSDVSDSLWPHGLQHARLPCPSPTPGVCSMSLQTHVRWVHNAIQPSHPVLPSSPSALNLSQNQSLFQWINSLHQEAKVLELQLQHQSFQWIFRVPFPLGLTSLISLLDLPLSKGLSRALQIAEKRRESKKAKDKRKDIPIWMQSSKE